MSAAICPECVQGKHINCDGTTWDNAADQPTSCACACTFNPNGAA